MKYPVLFFILLFQITCFAHIGSPDIVYEGNAGPYKILATIQPPDVVPGTAQINVQIEGSKATKVLLQPIYYQYGSKGAPKADRAESVKGENNFFQGSLWLMAFGSASVRITVEGAKGIGSTLVPVSALATATRKMDKTTEWVLIPMGLLLFAGLVTIIGVSVGQATTEPDKAISTSQKKRSRVVMAFFSLFLITGLYFAKVWWDKVEAEYKEFMYKPLYLHSELKKVTAGEMLVLHLKNRPWFKRNLSDIVPDHGKLIHLFVIEDRSKAFAHLHPQQQDSSTYSSLLPSLPSGKYIVLADIVHENGLSETLMDSLLISTPLPTSTLSDPDDSWAISSSENAAPANDKALTIQMLPSDSIRSKHFTKISFKLKNGQGEIVSPEPYLGMTGHAVVMKKDHSVFIHLHPMGTVSMASQNALAGKVSGEVTLCNPLSDSLFSASDTLVGLADVDRISLMRGQKEKRSASSKGIITFPYSFPSAGEYDIWVQVKKNKVIYTEKFSVRVSL